MLPGRMDFMEVRNPVLNPAEAEVWITAVPTDCLGGMELRGRLMGPRCPYSTTIEVAYPLQPLPLQSEKPRHLTARVIIPEPSLWDPESPFLYQGPVEVWKDHKRFFEMQMSHGLRQFQLGPRGLRWNSRLLTIRGVECQGLSKTDALRLRQAGYNTLLAPVSKDTTELWDAADWFGFLVLGRLTDDSQMLRQASLLRLHPSCLGWLLVPEMLASGFVLDSTRDRLLGQSGYLIGVETNQVLSEDLLHGIHFILCEEESLPLTTEVQRPKIIGTKTGRNDDSGEKTIAALPGILGWIDRG